MTYNQILRRIKTLAADHRQIRNFYNGMVQDFLTDKTTLYPSAFLQNTTGNLSTAGKALTVGFRLFLVDLVNVSENTKANVDDVQSDMVSIAMDLVAQMNFPGFDDWRLSEENNLQLVEDEYENDMVAGCYVDFTIRIRFPQNVCQVPTTFDEYGSINDDMKLTYDEIYITTGNEGSTLTIPALAGKKILLIIRENNTLYKVSNLPDTTQYTFDGTDIGLGAPVEKVGERFLILYRTL